MIDINSALAALDWSKEPKGLYEPIAYALETGGKRIRPTLALTAAEAVINGGLINGDAIDHVLPAALALEVFHNFTLLHDDVMDKAPVRRGRETVHIKWNANTAILSGDQMLIEAYKLPYVAYNQGSICHLECTAPMSFDFSTMNPLGPIKALSKKSMMMTRTEAMKRMGAAYMAHGIVTLAGSRLYTSMADTDEIIDEALNHFEDVFKLVKKTGVLSEEVAEYAAAHKEAKEKAIAATKAKQAKEKAALDAKKKAAKEAAKAALAAEKAKKDSWNR